MPESYSVEAVLTAKDQNFTSTFKNANTNISSFGKLAGKGLSTIAKVGVAAVTGAAGGIAYFAKKSIDAGQNFDSAMSQVAATMGTTVDQIGEMRDFAQEMGSTTAFSASEAADAMNILAMAGYDAKENIATLPAVLNMAAAGGLGIAEAADYATGIIAGFSNETLNASDVADKLAVVASSAKGDVKSFGEGLSTVAGMANTTGQSMQDMTVALGILGNHNYSAAEAGNALSRTLKNIYQPTSAAKKAMDNLGIAAYDSTGKARPLQDVLKDINAATKDMSDEAKNQALSQIFDAVTLKSVPGLLNDCTTAWDELDAKISDSAGAAEKMAAVQLDNLEGDTTMFKSALEGAQIALSDGLNPALRFLVQSGTAGLEKLTNVFKKLDKYMTAGVNGFKSVKGVGSAVKEALSALASELFGVQSAFGSKDSIKSFGDACKAAAEKIKSMAEWLRDNAAKVSAVIKAIPKLIAAFAGLSALSKVAPILKAVGGAFGKIGAAVGSKVTSALPKFGKGVQSAGTAASTSSAGLMASAKAFVLIGAAVLEIAAAFALLAFSAIQLASAGGAAIAVFFGMVAAVAALVAVFTLLTKAMATINPATLTSISVAFVAMGAAILLVAAGFALLALSAVSLASAGGAAIAVFFGMVASIAALVAVFALLGPALTAGAVGFVAFGAAILLVGAGIALACAGIALLATQLPLIAAFGTQAAVGIAALGAALLVLGAGAIVAGAGLAVLSVGLVAFSVAIVAASVACGVLAVAVGLLGVAFAVAFAAAAGAVLIVVAALKLMQSSLSTIASKAKQANASITSMKNGLSVVNAGLTAVGQKAGQIASTIINAFKKAGTSVGQTAQQMAKALLSFAQTAAQSGQQAGQRFSSGLTAGMNSAVNAARSAINAIASAMRSGYSSAYSAGQYIGQGLANGMSSMLGRVRSIASQLAAAANQAIAAKAKIGSPSKVTTYYGEMVGQGFINGMNNKTAAASDAAAGLFDPSISVPNYAYAGGLNNDYNYNTRSTIVVPLSIDGKEFARATAPYNIAENNKAQARANRAKGWR